MRLTWPMSRRVLWYKQSKKIIMLLYIRVKGVRWYTNLDLKQRHEKTILVKRYSSELYPTYDNYEAIDVSKVSNIPCDYAGIMGVPITFMDKYNPDQFDIIGCADYTGKYGADDIGVGHIGEKWIETYRNVFSKSSMRCNSLRISASISWNVSVASFSATLATSS